jgi:hypothetical protein
MPGSYAHITLSTQASEKWRLKAIPGFPPEAIDAANLHTKFLNLGSISPDYPYLDILSGDSLAWADAMHYTHTCKDICIGAEVFRGLLQEPARGKCLSWLMGYTSHVVMDMYIHPVIELKVGTYSQNKTNHRRCEMHEDAYIFRRMGLGMPQTSDYLKATIGNCGLPNNPKRLDEDIKDLWLKILRNVYASDYTSNPPDLDEWHQRCQTILESFLPTTSRLVGFARHVCNRCGLLYPTPDEVDATYIDHLQTPTPAVPYMTYDDVFDSAIKKVEDAWLEVTRYALNQADQISFRDKEWNLDTGKDELAEAEGCVLWKIV